MNRPVSYEKTISKKVLSESTSPCSTNRITEFSKFSRHILNPLTFTVLRSDEGMDCVFGLRVATDSSARFPISKPNSAVYNVVLLLRGWTRRGEQLGLAYQELYHWFTSSNGTNRCREQLAPYLFTLVSCRLWRQIVVEVEESLSAAQSNLSNRKDVCGLFPLNRPTDRWVVCVSVEWFFQLWFRHAW